MKATDNPYAISLNNELTSRKQFLRYFHINFHILTGSKIDNNTRSISRMYQHIFRRHTHAIPVNNELTGNNFSLVTPFRLFPSISQTAIKIDNRCIHEDIQRERSLKNTFRDGGSRRLRRQRNPADINARVS